jgi:hypothetical protein
MCLCVYVFMCLCVYVFMCLCVYVLMYLYIYVFMYLCVYVFMCLCIYVFMHLSEIESTDGTLRSVYRYGLRRHSIPEQNERRFQHRENQIVDVAQIS